MEERPQRHQSLTAHGIGTAGEEHFDLMIVDCSRVGRKPAIGLKMEVLQIVARVTRPIGLIQNFVVPAAMPPPLDRAQIPKVARRTAESPHRLLQQVVRHAIETGIDILPVALQQPTQIGKDLVLPGKGSLDGSLRFDRPGQTGRERVLTEVHADPCRLPKSVSRSRNVGHASLRCFRLRHSQLSPFEALAQSSAGRSA